ncbi:hypothetical protein B7463_g4866, partial [Scytalidium lignicola]
MSTTTTTTTTESTIKVAPLLASPSSKTNIGAIITGVDLNDLSEKDFQEIRKAIYVHRVVVVRGQHKLHPAKQFEFVRRIDPDSGSTHGFYGLVGDKKSREKFGSLGTRKRYVIPGVEGVRLIGRDYQAEEYYGLKNIYVDSTTQAEMLATPLSDEEISEGNSRFVTFHMDGAIYDAIPSRVTALLCIKAPRGPPVTVRWDDDSGTTMKAAPGLTAFIDTVQLYNLLSDEEKALVENSRWEPAPHPFAWTGTRRLRSCGLGIAPGGEVLPLDKLPEWSPEKIYQFPMVWVNPVTGEKGLHIFCDVIRKLHFKSSPDGPERVVDDLEEIRTWLNNIMDRICKPEYISIPPYDEGDLVLFNNWGVIHSAIEYPVHYGSRLMHQCHVSSSTAPTGTITEAIENPTVSDFEDFLIKSSLVKKKRQDPTIDSTRAFVNE